LKEIKTPLITGIIVIIAIAGICGYLLLTSGSKAKFEVASFTVSSTEALVGENTTCIVKVKNGGGAEGTYNLIVKLDNSKTFTQEVILQPDEEREIFIIINWENTGVHTLEAGDFTKTVEVKTPTLDLAVYAGLINENIIRIHIQHTGGDTINSTEKIQGQVSDFIHAIENELYGWTFENPARFRANDWALAEVYLPGAELEIGNIVNVAITYFNGVLYYENVITDSIWQIPLG